MATIWGGADACPCRPKTDQRTQKTFATATVAFDAASAIAKSKPVPEAIKLQTNDMQSQMAKASEQTREFFELSAKLTQQTFATFNSVAQKSMTNGKGGMYIRRLPVPAAGWAERLRRDR